MALSLSLLNAHGIRSQSPDERQGGRGWGEGKRRGNSKLTGEREMGPVRASDLHLTLRRLPRLSAAAPARRLPAPYSGQ
ncbi:hypothetical protein AAY473_039702 [Plecturocebus cupreus]